MDSSNIFTKHISRPVKRPPSKDAFSKFVLRRAPYLQLDRAVADVRLIPFHCTSCIDLCYNFLMKSGIVTTIERVIRHPFFAMRTRLCTLAIAIALIIGAAVLFVNLRAMSLPQTYRSNTYKFSLNLPVDYKVTEVPSANPPNQNPPLDIIEFGNTVGSIQLYIEPASDNGSTLTIDGIISNHPYIANEALEPFIVAPGVTGFSVSERRDHTGQMSELWFEHAGYLYQFSAFDAGREQLSLVARTISLFY